MPKLNPVRALTAALESGPQRVFGLSLFVNTLGLGLVTASMTLYYIRVVHLSTGQVSVGLTIAGLVGLLAGIPMGDLADRRGPRGMVRILTLAEGIITFCYLFVHSFAIFLVVATADMLALTAAIAAGGPLVRRLSGENAAAFRSATYAISNLGISLGAVGCGVAVEIGTADAYRALVIGNAVSFVLSWVVMARLPHFEPLPKPATGQRWGALTDKAFVMYTALSGAMSMQYYVITLSLPIWVVSYTDAPRWSVALFLVVNTVIVVSLQVRLGKNVETIRQGGSALRRSGVVFLLSCAAIGFAAGLPAWAAFALLLGAITLHTIGEIWYTSGSFAMSFGLPPAHAQGQYQGLATIGSRAGQAVAPALLIGLVLGLGKTGWLGLGAFFVLLGLASPALARWGERTRPAPEPVSDVAPGGGGSGGSSSGGGGSGGSSSGGIDQGDTDHTVTVG